MNSVRGYVHDRYAALGVCNLRFLRYVLLNSSKEMKDRKLELDPRVIVGSGDGQELSD